MDGDKHWYDDDRLYPSVSNSDDSPILSHRYENSRLLSPYAAPKVRERRSTFTVLAKFFLFCTAMILFCVLLYIPVYNKANDLSNVRVVAGWSMDTNRDTKIYVQPKNNTTIHSPRNICPRSSNDRLFLLIVVCSSTVNFKRREAIRETWGNYRSYQEMSKLYHTVKQRYITYNYTYDLYNEQDANNVSIDRVRRDISSFSRLLPELAKVLKDNLVNNEKTDDVLSEKRFDDDVMLPEFDMNAELGENTVANYEEYYEDTNIMKIPPKGYEDTPDLEKVLSMLKGNKNFKKVKEKLVLPNVSDPDYKVVFLLGMPTNDNDSYVQNKIEEESEKYGDVIQEGFVDSYNNLTLKSIMMLKWITNNCNDSVRYFLKTDDDMYINVPSLIENLRNRSRDFDLKNKGRNAKEYMLIGDLICGARPVSDFNNKWYSPKYMYGGHVYPKYLSGTGYALSAAAARALYGAALRTNYFHLEDVYITVITIIHNRSCGRTQVHNMYGGHVNPMYLSGTGYALSAAAARALYGAALRTNYFHLEDVYITGFCAGRAHPRIIPRDDSSFSYLTPWWASGGTRWSGSVMRACAVHARATAHRVAPDLMVKLHTMLRRPVLLDTCERMRLTKVKEQQRKNNVVSKFIRILVTTECK